MKSLKFSSVGTHPRWVTPYRKYDSIARIKGSCTPAIKNTDGDLSKFFPSFAFNVRNESKRLAYDGTSLANTKFGPLGLSRSKANVSCALSVAPRNPCAKPSCRTNVDQSSDACSAPTYTKLGHALNICASRFAGDDFKSPSSTSLSFSFVARGSTSTRLYQSSLSRSRIVRAINQPRAFIATFALRESLEIIFETSASPPAAPRVSVPTKVRKSLRILFMTSAATFTASADAIFKFASISSSCNALASSNLAPRDANDTTALVGASDGDVHVSPLARAPIPSAAPTRARAPPTPPLAAHTAHITHNAAMHATIARALTTPTTPRRLWHRAPASSSATSARQRASSRSSNDDGGDDDGDGGDDRGDDDDTIVVVHGARASRDDDDDANARENHDG
mmetsp:Transcript_5114/g.11166  ORF Transcript_5114/g.11166 Transcript_5114/m.11166 type:complete len:395 (+) Transcript_5114:1750-2934(+)